ncbi:MAG: hypothetical protein KA105_03815 [Caulobacter sp.]|nr:hypothetical protein [Caulobacter sp.]
MIRIALTGAAALALVAGPALADGWLESVARQAAGRAVANGVADAATRDRKPGKGESRRETPAAEAPPAPVAASDPNVSNEDPFAEPGVAAPTAPAAAVANGGDGGLQPVNGDQMLARPGQMAFDPSVAAAKERFVEFSRYSCTACEGGRGYDAWARQSLNLGGGYNAFEKKLGSLATGQFVAWKGIEADGRITVVGEATVAGFQCKQLKWELKKRKTGASASRDGLLCLGKSGDYAASDSWVEVV